MNEFFYFYFPSIIWLLALVSNYDDVCLKGPLPVLDSCGTSPSYLSAYSNIFLTLTLISWFLALWSHNNVNIALFRF